MFTVNTSNAVTCRTSPLAALAKYFVSSFFSSFSPQHHVRGRGQPKVARLQDDDFADPSSGVEQQTQENEITPAGGCRTVNAVEHGLDFRIVEMLDLTAAGPLERDPQDTLAKSEMLRVLRTEITKETVDRA